MQQPTGAGPDAEERHLVVPRRARYYVLGDPRSADELWVACHGYGQLAGRFARHFAHVADPRRAVVVPEALNRFYLDDPRRPPGAHGSDARIGATWMTREDREAEIADYVEYLDLLVAEVLAGRAPALAPPTITVLGFSQGTATACRWLVHGRTRAARLILWAGRVPPEMHPLSPESPLRQARIQLLSGDEDQLVTTAAMKEEGALLAGAGVAAPHQAYPGGHRLHAQTLARLAVTAP